MRPSVLGVLVILASGLCAMPLAAHAQQAHKMPTIGVLWHAGSAEEEAHYLIPFQEELAALGYIQGRTINIRHTFAAEQYERLNSHARKLANAPVDVLVAVTRPAALAAQRATSTIPIIFILVPDPVSSQLVQSLARPGGNITGLTNIGFELHGKRLEFLKEATGLARVALLINVSDPASARFNTEAFHTAARALGIQLEVVGVHQPDELKDAFDSIAHQGLSAVITGIDPMLWNERKQMAELAVTRRIAVMAQSGEMTRDGLLFSYAANYPIIFRRAAHYVDKILRGAKPQDIPVEQPTKFELIINLKTAKAIGLTIPPTVLFQADEVIR